MPTQVRGTRDQMLDWRDLDVLRRDLGFRDAQEMKEWLGGRRFWPFFEAYAKQWIWPQQAEARKAGGNRARGVGLATIERRLIAGEDNNDKYSHPHPDTKDWTKVDYQALLLHQIRVANIGNREGLFYDRALSDAEINSRIWTLVKHAEFEQAPSRGKRRAIEPQPEKRGATDPQPEKRGAAKDMLSLLEAAHTPNVSQLGRSQDASQQLKTGGQQSENVRQQQPLAAGALSRDSENLGQRQPLAAGALSRGDENVRQRQPLAAGASSRGDRSRPSITSIASVIPPGREVIDLTTPSPPNSPRIRGETPGIIDVDEYTNSLTEGYTEVKIENYDDQKPQGIFGDSPAGDVPLTIGQRIAAEYRSATPNVKYRFWKLSVCDKLIRTDDPDALRHEVNYAADVDNFSAQESELWRKELVRQIEENSIVHTETDAQTAEDYELQQKYLDNLAYQRENIAEACDRLGIYWDGPENTILRIPGMAISKQMSFWQVVGVKCLLDFLADTMIRGFILGDTVGLGKTWTVIIFLLQTLRDRALMRPVDRPRAQPILILLPPVILSQWIAEINAVVPGQFKIYLYYGDRRTNREAAVPGMEVIDGLLTKRHPIFDGQEQNARVIVISTYSTFAERNGPKAQKAWRRNKRHFSAKMADKMEGDLDVMWEGNLSRCFRIVACDECHILKDIKAKSSIAVQWLNADKHLLISATSIPNGAEDFRTYMKLIESRDADSWWSQNSLTSMGIDENDNPYELPDDHPASKLILTYKAANEYIFRSSVSGVAKGLWLGRILRRVLLRRTNTSTIPFKNGRRIGDSLPALKSVMIKCSHNPREAVFHRNMEDELTGKLIVSGTESGTKGKAKYSLSIHRKLQLLAMSLNLPTLDDHFDLKAGAMKSLFEEEGFHLPWLRHLSPNQEFVAANPDDPLQQLTILVDGAPKIKALLRNVRDQVIRDNEKALIFCQLPASTALIFAVLRLLRIKVAVLSSFQSERERNQIVKDFNEGDELMVIITVYALAAAGLNLQKKCWRVHAVECNYNLGIIVQIIGRSRRLGNPSPYVWFYEYFVSKSFDSKAIMRMLEKAVPQTMAELNREIFYGTEAGEDTVDIGDWVIENGELIPYNEATQPANILTPNQLIRQILLLGKGEQIEV